MSVQCVWTPSQERINISFPPKADQPQAEKQMASSRNLLCHVRQGGQHGSHGQKSTQESFVLRFGNKEKHGSDLGQMDQAFCHPELSFLGSSNGLELSRSLCQVSKRCSPSVHFHDSVFLDGSEECPPGCLNQIENGGAGIPTVHQDHKGHPKLLNGLFQNLLRDLDLA